MSRNMITAATADFKFRITILTSLYKQHSYNVVIKAIQYVTFEFVHDKCETKTQKLREVTITSACLHTSLVNFSTLQ